MLSFLIKTVGFLLAAIGLEPFKLSIAFLYGSLHLNCFAKIAVPFIRDISIASNYRNISYFKLLYTFL